MYFTYVVISGACQEMSVVVIIGFKQCILDTQQHDEFSIATAQLYFIVETFPPNINVDKEVAQSTKFVLKSHALVCPEGGYKISFTCFHHC